MTREKPKQLLDLLERSSTLPAAHQKGRERGPEDRARVPLFFLFFFLACEPQNLIQYVWFDTLSNLLCFWGSLQSTQNYGTKRYLRQQTKPTLGFGTNMDEKIFESEVLH